MSLDDLRKSLSDIDRQIVELISERQRIVSEIGRSKQSSGAGTRDYAREIDVLDMGRAQAEELGIDPDLAESVLRQLIRSSLASQERDRVISEGKGDGRSALIIGGAGKMGRWFAEFLGSQGFAVEIADPAARSRDVGDWRDVELSHDLIIVATPIKVTGGVLRDLAERRPAGLIIDIGSLKTPLRDGLARLAHQPDAARSWRELQAMGRELALQCRYKIREIGLDRDEQVVADRVAAVDNPVTLFIEAVEQLDERAALPVGRERGTAEQGQQNQPRRDEIPGHPGIVGLREHARQCGETELTRPSRRA